MYGAEGSNRDELQQLAKTNFFELNTDELARLQANLVPFLSILEGIGARRLWQVVQELRRGRERYGGDERILGRSEFVERVRQAMSERLGRSPVKLRDLSVEGIVEKVCQEVGIRAEELHGRGRRAQGSRARAGIAYLWLEWLGHSGATVARAVGIRPAMIYEVARRGRQAAAYWEQLGVSSQHLLHKQV